MSKIYFDLDGVLRSLSVGIGMVPQTWDDRAPNGQGFCEYIDDNLGILLEAPRTKYLPVALSCGRLEIVTHQPLHWRPNTLEWIKRNLPIPHVVHFVNSPTEKLKFLEAGYLVEDYPKFPPAAYRRILLVDYPYNRGIDAFARICEPLELKLIIGALNGSRQME